MDFYKLKEPYFIGDIGINHNGDLQIAKKLIDAIFACNWDCAKFQKRNPDVAVPEKQKSVMRDTPWGRIPYIEYKYIFVRESTTTADCTMAARRPRTPLTSAAPSASVKRWISGQPGRSTTRLRFARMSDLEQPSS